jgi:ubiquinone/menaquinone biosynthesis C-methylase UbiE
MIKVKKNYGDPWEGYAKRYATLYWQPGKPSAGDLQIYSNFMKKASGGKKGKVLVLGATPSVRDVVSKFSTEICCIDMSAVMFKEMTKLTHHNKKEKFVQGNWIKMPFPDNYFDMVVGDLVFENLDARTKPLFVKEVHRVLQKGGYWIHRIFYVPENFKYKSTTAILKKFSKKDALRDRNMELFCTFLYNTYNPRTHEVDAGKIKKAIAVYWKNGRYSYPESRKVEKWMNKAYQMWTPFKKKWHLGRKEESFAYILKKFDILKEGGAKDHYFGRTFPIIMCRAK